MKYAKLINNLIELAPQNKGAVINYNVNVELMKKDGYKEFLEVERPTTIRQYHIEYNETASTIAEKVVYDETQAEAEERQRRIERERIGRLNMTKLDFVNVLEGYNVTYEAIRVLLDSNYEAKKQWDLCERVYRFNPFLEPMASQFGITPEQLDEMFIAKGEV